MATRCYTWRGRHDVHFERRGLGDPLLLVHNLYPGASRGEFEPNLAELSRHFTVYNLDLLGFGDSAAPRLKYTAELYIDLLHDFLRDVIAPSHDAPPHAMSGGLSCAYLTELAARDGGALGRLVFVCPRSEPTGLDAPRWAARIQRFVLTAPGMGAGFYETVAGRYGITQYLNGCFYDPRSVTKALVERLLYNAHRPGSIHPYASLITGYLDHPLLAPLPKVKSPLLLVWGRQARPTPVEHSVRLLALAQDVRLRVIERAGSWVHDERAAEVDRLVLPFLNGEMPQEHRAETA